MSASRSGAVGFRELPDAIRSAQGLRLLAALAGLAVVVGCHRAEPPAQASASAASAAASAPAQDTTKPAWTPPAGAKPRPEIVAFHAPHHALECSRCHGTPPGHSTHHDVPCIACHVRPTEYAGLKQLPITACRSCHHGADQTRTCAHCHPLDTRSNVIEVTTTFDPTVAKAPTKRTLGFNHVWHDSLACANCHTHTPNEAVTRECRSCHARHHTPTATCARCHDPKATLAKHTMVVHTGCGQAGCHADGVASHFPPTRAVCLSCHAAQVNHRPGGDCATCHQIRAGWKQ